MSDSFIKAKRNIALFSLTLLCFARWDFGVKIRENISKIKLVFNTFAMRVQICSWKYSNSWMFINLLIAVKNTSINREMDVFSAYLAFALLEIRYRKWFLLNDRYDYLQLCIDIFVWYRYIVHTHTVAHKENFYECITSVT